VGVEYTATVNLTAASGYTFAGIAEDTFTYTGTGITVTHEEGLGPVLQVTVTFPPTVAAAQVSLLNLAPYLSEPVRGGTAAGALASGQYTGLVAWEYESAPDTWSDKPLGPFEKNTKYRAVVNLTAVSGYTFAGIAVPSTSPCFTYTGAGVTVTHQAGSGPVLQVTVTFPATLSDTPVNDRGPDGEGSAAGKRRDSGNVCLLAAVHGNNYRNLEAV
jgi:hypothetical protein